MWLYTSQGRARHRRAITINHVTQLPLISWPVVLHVGNPHCSTIKIYLCKLNYFLFKLPCFISCFQLSKGCSDQYTRIKLLVESTAFGFWGSGLYKHNFLYSSVQRRITGAQQRSRTCLAVLSGSLASPQPCPAHVSSTPFSKDIQTKLKVVTSRSKAYVWGNTTKPSSKAGL